MNNANVKNTGKYAVSGGNEEIIHLCEQNHSSFEDAYETAIKFHRNDIFKYLYENKLEEINNLEKLGEICISYHNYEIFLYQLERGMKINENIINKSAKKWKLISHQVFLEENIIPKNIILYSSESGNIELVEYILKQEGIDINSKDVYLFHLKFILII